jgi:hypothetical protein
MIAPATGPAGASAFARRAGKLAFAVLIVATAGTAYPAGVMQPVAGDIYVYRVINAYNNEIRGQVTFKVDNIDADRMIMAVSTETPGSSAVTMATYTLDGNWLRHPVTNRDQPVDYEFAPAYPAYRFPLDPGKEWSVRVNAVNPATGEQRSVRVDAKVIGNERIRVPAGEFDTVKIRRAVYAGDSASYLRLTETTISETEWFAPALGRSVRLTTDSHYQDLARRRGSQTMNGDRNTYELTSAPLPR